MKFFEKNIKDRFKNASSLEGVDADDLWNSIESGMVEESPERKSFFFRKRNWLFLISLFVIVGGITWVQLSDESTSVTDLENSNAKNQIQDIEEKNSNAKEVDKTTNNTSISEIEIENPTIVQSEELNNTLIKNSPIVENKNQIIASDTKSETPTLIEKKNNIVVESGFSKNESTPIIFTDDKSKDTEIQSEVLKNETPFTLQVVDFEKIGSINLLLELEKKDQLDLNDLIILSDFNKRYPRFSLGVFTGVHTVKNKFSSKLDADKERSELLNQGYDYELGKSFAIEANFRLYKNLFLTSGFEYVQSKSEFNLIQNWDTTIVNINSPVGAFTDAEAVRTIKHHNKLNYFSIPILLGVQKSIGKFEVGASAGIGLNFTKSQTGKSVDSDNQITLYPIVENELLPISNFFYSYHLRPHLTYRFNDDLSFQFRTDIRYQNFGNSTFHNLDYSSIFWGLSGGVQYKF